jgi:hypothetical protein
MLFLRGNRQAHECISVQVRSLCVWPRRAAVQEVEYLAVVCLRHDVSTAPEELFD